MRPLASRDANDATWYVLQYDADFRRRRIRPSIVDLSGAGRNALLTMPIVTYWSCCPFLRRRSRSCRRGSLSM